MFKQRKIKFFLLTTGLALLFAMALWPVSTYAMSHNPDMVAVVVADCRELVPGKCRIVDYLQLFIRFLSAAVGVVIVIMIAVRGIQYTAARENPQIVHNARIGILNAIMALLLYLFTFAFLQWIVPGGVI